MSIFNRLRRLEQRAIDPAREYVASVRRWHESLDQWKTALAMGEDPGPTPPVAEGRRARPVAEESAWRDRLIISMLFDDRFHGYAKIVAGEWPEWAPENCRQWAIKFLEAVAEDGRDVAEFGQEAPESASESPAGSVTA